MKGGEGKGVFANTTCGGLGDAQEELRGVSSFATYQD